MKPETLKKLQEIGAFVLANGCNKKGLKQTAEMIRSARHYRWVAIYKVTSKEFVALTGTGDEPVAYPRFPLSQGICGAVLESGKTIALGDVRKDARCLPAFHTTRSEMIAPMINEEGRIVGMLDAESAKLNAFDAEDKKFLERAGSIIAHCLS
jgi:GAF domain-containing protein